MLRIFKAEIYFIFISFEKCIGSLEDFLFNFVFVLKPNPIHDRLSCLYAVKKKSLVWIIIVCL